MKMGRSLVSGLATVSFWLSACGGPKEPALPAPGPLTPEQEKIKRLLTEILDQARPSGCAAANECKTAGLGYSGCGPRQYVVYCPRNVDEPRLQQRLDELSKLEQAEAQRQSEPPPCRPSAAPEPEVFDGTCRAKL